ncbi:MAG: segregation/condensation protein A [Candidatus Pacearchaeota archaeon]
MNFQEGLVSDLIEKDDASWQYILLELVKSNQINPWDIDIIALTNSFLGKIEELDKAGLFISSKVLLVAALLLKLKTELLLSSLIKKEEKVKKEQELAFNALNIDYASELLPRIPLTRERKITLAELVQALKSAIKTEERRIRRKIYFSDSSLSFVIPKKRISWFVKIKEVYARLIEFFKKNGTEVVFFSQLLKTNEKEEKVTLFVPLLHLDFQNKIAIRQESFLSDIEIRLNKSKSRQ